MKKLLCLLLVLCVLLSVGCTNPQGGGETSADPSGGETTADASGGETTGEPEAYTPQWHLSETIEDEAFVDYDIGVIVPYTTYEKDMKGLLFRVEFFEEFYPLGSILQVRLSITNNKGMDIEYDLAKTLGAIVYTGPNNSFYTDKSVALKPVSHQDVRYYSAEEDYYSLPATLRAGETVVFERAIRINPVFFTPGEYEFRFTVMPPKPVEPYAVFTFPIAVVNRNTP